MKPRILVTSAAGKTGLQTSLQLLEKGYPVRALVRSDDHRARQLRDAGAEIFVGDQFSLADMRQAMTEVQRAYHCAPTAPNALHFGSVFAIAAHEAKLEHVVLLGQWLADPNHHSVFTREVWLNEAIVKLLPDTPVTVNNVGWFAENYFMGVLEPAAQLGLLPMPLGDGDQTKNAPPSNEDIAAVSVAALVDPATHAGKTYRPTGPELLSPNEIAGVMGKVLGRKVRYMDVPEVMMLKALKVQGFPEAMPTQLRHYTQEYRRGTFAVDAPNTVVRDLTGREAENFETIARRIIASRPEARRTLANRLRALRTFAGILMTSAVNADAIEQRRDHVLLQSSTFADESPTWRDTHGQAAPHVVMPVGRQRNDAALAHAAR